MMKRKFTALLLVGCMVIQSAFLVAAEDETTPMEPETYQCEETEATIVSESEDSDSAGDVEIPPIEEEDIIDQNTLPEDIDDTTDDIADDTTDDTADDTADATISNSEEPLTNAETEALKELEETEEFTQDEENAEDIPSDDTNPVPETLPPAEEPSFDEPEIIESEVNAILLDEQISTISTSSGTTEKGIMYQIDGDAVSITGFDSEKGTASGILEIPSKIEDKPVTKISSGAFSDRSGFTGLSLPDSLTTIENSAFSGCSGFTGTLTLPASLTTIEYYTFYGCSGFTGLSLPNNLTTIEDEAFYGCFGFTGSLTLPASLTTIGDGAFYGCSGFTGKLTIPPAAKVAGNAFFDFICINKRFDYGVELWAGEKRTFTAYGATGTSSYLSLNNDSSSTVTWSSSNDSVARVDKGVVTAVSAGDATITARAYNGQTSTVKIRVLSKQSGGYDNLAPVINSITFPQSITKPGVLTLSLNITEEDTGLVSVYGSFYNVNNSSQFISFNSDWNHSPKFSGTHQLAVPVSSKIQSGKYYLGNICLQDENGNIRQYSSYDITDYHGQFLCSQLMDQSTGGAYDVNINVNSGSNSLLVKDEFNVNFQTSITNSSITSRLNSMPEGTTAMINFNSSNHTAKKEWFEAIKGKDKTIVLSNDGIQWRFYGKSISAPKNIDCLVQLQTNTFSEYGGKETSLKVVFASNGTLPGPATVRLKSDYLSNIYQISQQLFLYYIKSDESLQQEGNATYLPDGTDHWCEFSLTHNSSFIVSGRKLSTTSRKVTSIKLNKSSIGLQKGKSVTLKATVSPSSAVNKKLKWTTSNSKIATVSSSGKITGKGYGTVTITAASTDGSKKTAKCKVTVGYGITYKLNGGKNNSQNPSAYYKQKITLKSPTRKNYIFSGWYTDKNCRKKITKITTKNKSNLTLYAKWKKAAPGKPVISSLKNSSGKKAVLKFKKISGVSGYQIIYGTDKKFKKDSAKITTKKTSVTLKNLKKGKTYYVKIRAYQKDSTGKNVYGGYSKISSVKIKK